MRKEPKGINDAIKKLVGELSFPCTEKGTFGNIAFPKYSQSETYYESV
jgi:hypothetical protein